MQLTRRLLTRRGLSTLPSVSAWRASTSYHPRSVPYSSIHFSSCPASTKSGHPGRRKSSTTGRLHGCCLLGARTAHPPAGVRREAAPFIRPRPLRAVPVSDWHARDRLLFCCYSAIESGCARVFTGLRSATKNTRGCFSVALCSKADAGSGARADYYHYDYY